MRNFQRHRENEWDKLSKHYANVEKQMLQHEKQQKQKYQADLQNFHRYQEEARESLKLQEKIRVEAQERQIEQYWKQRDVQENLVRQRKQQAYEKAMDENCFSLKVRNEKTSQQLEKERLENLEFKKMVMKENDLRLAQKQQKMNVLNSVMKENQNIIFSKSHINEKKSIIDKEETKQLVQLPDPFLKNQQQMKESLRLKEEIQMKRLKDFEQKTLPIMHQRETDRNRLIENGIKLSHSKSSMMLDNQNSRKRQAVENHTNYLKQQIQSQKDFLIKSRLTEAERDKKTYSIQNQMLIRQKQESQKRRREISKSYNQNLLNQMREKDNLRNSMDFMDDISRNINSDDLSVQLYHQPKAYKANETVIYSRGIPGFDSLNKYLDQSRFTEKNTSFISGFQYRKMNLYPELVGTKPVKNQVKIKWVENYKI